MTQPDLILQTLCERYGRPIAYWDTRVEPPVPVFEPPLDATEQAALVDLRAMARFGLQTLTLAEYRARKADIAALKAFMALPSPTQAQTLAAFQALVRVTGAMLKLEVT